MATIRVLTLVAAVLLARAAAAQAGCSSEVLLAVESKGEKFLSSSVLEPVDFNVRVNGKPVSISGIQPEGDLATVVILMDVSGSMDQTFGTELELARRIVAGLSPAQPTILVAFAEHSEVVASNRAEATAWLQTVTGLKKGQRRTALWDTIDNALSNISSPNPIFLLLSDGGDNISKVHADPVLGKLQESAVRVIWVEPRSEFATPEERKGADEMAWVAAATGGFAIRSALGFGTVRQVNLAVNVIGAYSRMRLDMPSGTPKSGKLKISVASSNRPELKGANLLYPERLRNCSSLTVSH